MEPPKRIELSLEEQAELITRVEEDSLTTSDRELFVGLIKFNHWLQNALTDKKVTIHKLKHTFFSTSDSPRKKSSNNYSFALAINIY